MLVAMQPISKPNIVSDTHRKMFQKSKNCGGTRQKHARKQAKEPMIRYPVKELNCSK